MENASAFTEVLSNPSMGQAAFEVIQSLHHSQELLQFSADATSTMPRAVEFLTYDRGSITTDVYTYSFADATGQQYVARAERENGVYTWSMHQLRPESLTWDDIDTTDAALAYLHQHVQWHHAAIQSLATEQAPKQSNPLTKITKRLFGLLGAES